MLDNVTASVDLFLDLPVFDLLDHIPSDLTVDLFVQSKSNSHPLSGTSETFRKIDPSFFTFDLPSLIPEPDIDDYPDDVQGNKSYREARLEYKETGKPHNDAVICLSNRIASYNLPVKLKKLKRVCEFVSKFDPSVFTSDDELDLWELPEAIRFKILEVYKQAFDASPYFIYDGGSTVKIDKPDCNLDSVVNIDSLIALKNENAQSSFAFVGKSQLVQVVKLIKSDVSASTLLKICYRLDSHLGGTKNGTTILASLRMLYGQKPSKKRKAD